LDTCYKKEIEKLRLGMPFPTVSGTELKNWNIKNSANIAS
jgi:hypothetical protein